ncbi:MAG: carbohydrate-binding protein [Limisphaerales bacterium]
MKKTSSSVRCTAGSRVLLASVHSAFAGALWKPRNLGFACLLLAITAWQFSASAQVDDFNSGTDTNWTRFDLSAASLPAASYSFPTDGFGGKACRIQAPAPPVPDAGPARAFSYRKDVTYTDFYVAMDIVAWDNTLDQAFGFLARASNINLGQTDGYVMNYDPNQGSGGHGQFQINRIEQEAPTTICAANVTLDPTHRYRFVLTGDTNGVFTGRVYDLADLTAPIATISATDTTFTSGYLGVFNFSRVDAADYTNPTTGKTDSTFDNYLATTLANAPTNVAFPGTDASVPGTPQVVNRSPLSNTNFYPATNRLSFTAATFSTNTISTIRLILNGNDNRFTILGSTNVSYTSPTLLPSTAYNASIVLSNSAGQVTTNTFAFDTFSEEFLGSPGVKVVEAEDYNFSSGQFQDDPPPSGLDINGNPVNGAGTLAGGYYNQAGTLNVDYFDYDTGSVGNDHLYRSSDGVGTQSGSAEIESVDVTPSMLLNDTIRQKYATNNLSEYEVHRTEGGEWMNYTRVFAPTNYDVYLRVASTATQHVRFDLVGGDPTTTNQTTSPQGPFLVPSTGIRSTYLYVPLTDSQGNLKTLSLSGTNTFRLTLAGPPSDTTKFTLALNYLVFVPTASAPPATVQLQSASALGGSFATETGAAIDSNAKKVTIALPTGNRFYRLSAGTALHITSVQIVKTNLVLLYE